MLIKHIETSPFCLVSSSATELGYLSQRVLNNCIQFESSLSRRKSSSINLLMIDVETVYNIFYFVAPPTCQLNEAIKCVDSLELRLASGVENNEKNDVCSLVFVKLTAYQITLK
jgi:hypothetical protein